MGLPSTRILSQPHCLEVLGGGQPLAGSVLSLSPPQAGQQYSKVGHLSLETPQDIGQKEPF